MPFVEKDQISSVLKEGGFVRWDGLVALEERFVILYVIRIRDVMVDIKGVMGG